jgi:hypothetical protein
MNYRLSLAALILLVAPMVKAQNRVGEIRDEDTRKIERRVEARNYTFFSFGPNQIAQVGNKKSGQHIAAGRLWEVSPHAAIKLLGEGAFNFTKPAASLFALTLGANGYLTPTDISPYLGLDFGYGGAMSDDDFAKDVAGWAGGVTLGVAFFRTSSVQMHLAARHLRIFSDNGRGQPSQTSIDLGVAF